MHFQLKRNGFTLTEILIVVAMIAILIALLFPVLARGRERVLRTSCASNLRQLAQAMKLYGHDNDGVLHYYPDSCVPGVEGQPGPPNPCWRNSPGDSLFAYRPYVRTPKLWVCPSDPYGAARLEKYDRDIRGTAFTGRGNWTSYDTFGRGSDSRRTVDEDMGYRDPRDPTRTPPATNAPLIWDGYEYWSWIHKEGLNVACLDTHAVWQKHIRIISLDWEDGRDPGVKHRLSNFQLEGWSVTNPCSR